MSAFATLERELSPLLSSLRAIIASPENTPTSLISAALLLSECDGIIAALTEEVTPSNGGGGQVQTPILKARINKIQRLKDEIQPIRDEVGKLSSQQASSSVGGGGGGGGGGFASTSKSSSGGFGGNSRQAKEDFDPFGTKLMTTMSTLNEQTQSLNDTQLLLSDSEAIGTSTLTTLSSQREQLLTANSRVQETKTLTGRAKITLRNMGWRAIRQKVFLYFVILTLVGINCVVLYYGFFKSKK